MEGEGFRRWCNHKPYIYLSILIYMGEIRMVKRIFIVLDDDEFEVLKKAKGEKTWKELMMEAVEE